MPQFLSCLSDKNTAALISISYLVVINIKLRFSFLVARNLRYINLKES